jgi:protein-S-isoprenylcysteine O-methyltransferase Ste14
MKLMRGGLRKFLVSLAIVLVLGAVALVYPLSSPPTESGLRSLLISLTQVLGVITGFMLVAYVFWANGTRAYFDGYGQAILPRLRDAMASMGATKVRFSSAILLAGATIEVDISQPFKLRGLPLIFPERPGDDWRNLASAYSDLESEVFRRAYSYTLATLIFFGLVLTSLAFGIGMAEEIARRSVWLSSVFLVTFAGYFIWLVIFFRLLLRPGAGVVVSVEKREADGTVTWFMPEFL